MIFFLSLFFFSFPLGDNVHCIAKGELKMERHKGSLFFQRRTEGLRAGIRQGQEKNGTARVGGGGVQMKMAAGAPAPASHSDDTQRLLRMRAVLRGSNNPADMRKFLNAL